MPQAKKRVVDGQLECSKCGQRKPVNEFEKCKHTSFGRRSRCRTCEGRVQPAGVRGRRPIDPVDGKFQCRICGEWKPVERFELQAACKHGRGRRCHECRIDQAQSYTNRNPRNFLGMLARNTKRASRQRGKRLARGFTFEALDLDYLVAIHESQQGRCALTGFEMSHEIGNGRAWANISIDRIDPTKGYERGNVRLVCAAVNLMRNDMTDDELRLWAYRIIHPV